MQNTTVSVIVPVYNTKEFLQRCVDSVLQQKNVCVQLVLVDDGSTDGSGALCDAVAATHQSVTVLHHKNSGAAAARDAGLAVATGEYVLFLDADDCYLSETALQRLCAMACQQEADVVCFAYTRVHTKTLLKEKPLSATAQSGDIVGEKETTLPKMMRRNVYTSSACLKLIRRCLLEQTQLRFRTALHCEDIPFCLRLLQRAQRPVFLDACLYGYTVRENSKTRVCNAQTVQDILTAIDLLRNEVDRENPLCAHYMSYIAFQYCTLLINAHLAQPAIEKTMWERILAQKDLLQYHENKIVHCVWLCARLFGVPWTSRLLALYFNICSQ